MFNIFQIFKNVKNHFNIYAVGGGGSPQQECSVKHCKSHGITDSGPAVTFPPCNNSNFDQLPADYENEGTGCPTIFDSRKMIL